jgi:hypothetical protein
MNEQNLEYLKKKLDYLGFGTKLNNVLTSAIAKPLENFTLGINQSYINTQSKKNPALGGDHVRFLLNFNRSKTSDMYFLNDYEVTLNKAGNSVPIRQVFDLERDNRINALQAYKLLSGNSFEKDVHLKPENGGSAEKRKVWFKLDLDIQDAYGNHPLKKFYPEFKFDLSEAIDRYPFHNLSEIDKEGMMKLLRNGNLASAEMTVHKKNILVFVTANPQFKGLDVSTETAIIRQDEIFPEKAVERKTMALAEISAENETEISADRSKERFPWEENKSLDQAKDQGMER